jgi:hypothetical protein
MGQSYKILVEKTEMKRQRRDLELSRWENNIQMNLTETGYEGLNWINLGKNRVL